MTPRSRSQGDSGDRPEDDRHQDDRPEDDRHQDERPDDESPEDDRSEDDRPEDERPDDGRYEDDRPEDERPDDGRYEDDGPEDKASQRDENGSDRRDRSQKRSAPEKRERTGSFAAGFGQTLPMALVGMFLLIYFVWLCTEMGSHAHDGLSIVIGTFAGILLGILAAAVAMGLRALALRTKGDRDG